MAILVMLIIILLNIALLVVVMRLGTQGEHHAELSADQSSAVLALHDKLGLPRPEPKEVAVVHDHSEDVANTIDAVADVIPTDSESTPDDVTQDRDEVAKFVEGDDDAEPLEQLAVDGDEAEGKVSEMVDDAKERVAEVVEDVKEEVAEAIEEAKEEVSEVVEDVKEAISGDDDDSDDDDDD